MGNNCCAISKKTSKGGVRKRFNNVNPRKKGIMAQSELQNQMGTESSRHHSASAEISVLILGDVGVGKTKIANCLNRKPKPLPRQDSIKKAEERQSVNLVKKNIMVDNEGISLSLIDIGGDEANKLIVKQHCKDVRCILLCFSLGSQKSFESLEEWLNNVGEEYRNIPVALIATRQDLGEQERHVSELKIE